MESCPPSGSRSAGNNGHGLRGDNARRSRAAWVAGHVHHRLGHPGPRPVPPQPGGPRTPRSTRCVCGGGDPHPPFCGKTRGGDTKLREKCPPAPLRGVSAVATHFWGSSTPRPCPRRRAGSNSGAQQVPVPGSAQVRSGCAPPLSPSPPPFPTLPTLPEPPSPHYSCYPKAASVPKRRHVRGKQSAIVPSLGTRGGGAGAAARRPPPGPRSDAIVMEIGLSPHAVELDVDSFSLEFSHLLAHLFCGKIFSRAFGVKLINRGL